MDRLAVILKVLEKVSELHSLGIIHSDIKPGNIVSLDAFFIVIKLIDLGMAGVSQTGFHGGTTVFLPPEYLQDDSSDKLSPQLDICSLAITIMYFEEGFLIGYYKIPSQCF